MINPYHVPGPNDNDPLICEPAVSMLRITWNLAWQGGVENLARVQGVDTEHNNTISKLVELIM